MTRTLTIACDEASCHRTITWEPDGVNPSPPGWDSIVDDDEVLDACPEHGPFIHTTPEA